MMSASRTTPSCAFASASFSRTSLNSSLFATRCDELRTSSASASPDTWLLYVARADRVREAAEQRRDLLARERERLVALAEVVGGEQRRDHDVRRDTPSFCVDWPPGRKKRAVVILSAPRPGGSGVTVCTVPLPKVWSSPVITAR